MMKKPKIKMSLGSRFIYIVVAILSVTLAVNAVYSLDKHKQKVKQQLLEQGETLGRYVALTSAEAILALDFVTLNNYMKDLTSGGDIIAGFVLDSSDQPMTSHPPRATSSLAGEVQTGRLTLVELIPMLHRQSNELQLLEFPIVHEGQPLGRLVLAISLHRLAEETRVALLNQLLVYCLIILVVSSSIYFAFNRNVLHPIEELIKGASRVAKGEYSKPVPVMHDHEMGALAESFNGMMEEVNQDQELLHYQANYDSLTGLPNRLLGMEMLYTELNRADHTGAGFAMLYIDLDNFKMVNDTLGHARGDELLEIVAKRLRLALRDSDTVSRLGGDEFLVLLPDTIEPVEAELIAERIQEAISAPMLLDEREIFVQSSIGIVMFPTDGDTAAALMANADNAMYQAKSPNSDSIRFFSAEMNESVQEHLSLYHDLHMALERGQMYLEFQPIVQSDTGEVVGAESLLRWHHPERGLIPPDVFVPIAEATGRIVSIGSWVLLNACEALAEWDHQGLQLQYMAVNVSRVQIEKGILDSVQQVLSKFDLRSDQLQLEITESALMEKDDSILQIMNSLKDMGVRLALDDFGTGFSALSYLKHFPLQILKIDKSFIAGLPDDEEDAALVNGISAMAHSLGLTVISEGVEDESQRDYLNAAANYYQQGYLFGRPMSKASFADLLRTHAVA